MKQLDFEHGTVTGNILGAAVPMLVAQILNLLYNIVDRIYIARIPKVGTAALGAVGLCFPLIVIITAFSNLYGSGGAPLFSIHRGKKETQTANDIMNTSFSMLCLTGVILMVVGMFMDITPAILIFTPIFLPIAQSLGMSDIQFGVMLIFNMCLGNITPPVGSVLFVGCGISKISIEDVTKTLLPYFAVLFLLLLAVTYIPALSLGVPKLMGLI